MHVAMRYGVSALSVVCATSVALARGHEAVEMPAAKAGTGLICDTEAQVEQFIALSRTEADLSAAIEAVNTAVGSPQACGLAKIHFVGEEEVRQMGTFKIVRVLIVGFNDGETWFEVQPPHFQFTIFNPGGRDV
jgi:hypothetical protein